MSEPLYNAPLSPKNRKVLGQGFFIFGLVMAVFGLSVIGFEWPLGGRERAIDSIILAIFGPKYAGIAIVGFLITVGVVCAYKGLRMWGQDA